MIRIGRLLAEVLIVRNKLNREALLAGREQQLTSGQILRKDNSSFFLVTATLSGHDLKPYRA